MTEGTMNKYPSTITGKTIEQIAEEKLDTKAKEYADEQITVYKIAYSYSEIEGAFYKAFKDGYRECEKEWQKKADYLKGKKESE